MSGPDGERVLPLKGGDQPYRVLVETMNEGAITATPDGVVLYSNRHFAELLGIALEKVMGASLYDVVLASEHAQLQALLREGRTGASKTELPLSGPVGTISAQPSPPRLAASALAPPSTSFPVFPEHRHSQ